MDMAHMAEHRVYVPASVILPRTRVEIALLAPNVIPSDVARAVLAKLEAAASVFDDAARLVEPMLRGTLSARSRLRAAGGGNSGDVAACDRRQLLVLGRGRPVDWCRLYRLRRLLMSCSAVPTSRPAARSQTKGRLPAIEAAHRAIAEHATLALALARKVRVDDRPNALVDEVSARFRCFRIRPRAGGGDGDRTDGGRPPASDPASRPCDRRRRRCLASVPSPIQS